MKREAVYNLHEDADSNRKVAFETRKEKAKEHLRKKGVMSSIRMRADRGEMLLMCDSPLTDFEVEHLIGLGYKIFTKGRFWKKFAISWSNSYILSGWNLYYPNRISMGTYAYQLLDIPL